MNPFLLKGYSGPKYFCDRESETEKIVKAIKNNQDITLYGYRRLGKSALIQHIFHQLNKEYICIYTDIWGSTNIEEFTKELANGIIKSNLFSKRKFSEKMGQFLKSIGASFSIGVDGYPSIDVIYNNKNKIFNSLEELFTFLSNTNLKIVIAIDEFQEIKKYYKGIPFEAKLRSLTQQCNNVSFIYSGSEQHLLNEIFTTYNMPFYQSTRMLSIDKIDHEKYSKFIINHFKSNKKPIDESIVDHILNICYSHTYYVQAISNYIFSLTNTPKSIEEFDSLYYNFIIEKSVFYTELPERLTKQQFVVVKGFGRTGLVSSPTSSDFMQVTGVSSPSSMSRVIKSLIEKQLILKDGQNLRLYDVFLEHFLRYSL